MKKIQPQTLYKYYPDHNLIFDNDYQKEELQQRKEAFSKPYFYCPSAKELNDPFEFQIKISQFKTVEEVLEFYRELVKAGISKVDLKNLELQLNEAGHEFMVKRSAEVNEGIQRETRKGVNLCSFTKRYNSILMWSHYASDHRGFCLKFSTEKANIKEHVKEVQYNKTDKFPVVRAIDVLKNDLDWIQQKLLATKHHGWSYEKEWRFLTHEHILGYDKSAVEQVLLGCNASEELEDELRGYFPDTEMLKARKSESSFSLHFEKLSQK